MLVYCIKYFVLYVLRKVKVKYSNVRETHRFDHPTAPDDLIQDLSISWIHS